MLLLPPGVYINKKYKREADVSSMVETVTMDNSQKLIVDRRNIDDVYKCPY